jgi:hypothetical protein
MTSIAQMCTQWQTLLTTTAAACERESGFVQRRSKLTGPLFVQTLVFGWLAHPDATLEQLAQTAALLGVRISAQGLAQRFTPAAAKELRQVLEAAVAQVVVRAEPVALPILARFAGVWVLDSTSLSLPEPLATLWAGCGGGHAPGQGAAALKLQVQLELRTGRLRGPLLQAGRQQDRRCPWQHEPWPPGSLRLADLGYFSLAVLAAQAERGAYWLTRLQAGTVVFDQTSGRRLHLPALLARRLPQQGQQGQTLDLAVELGVKRRVAARLLAVRVPLEVAAARRAALEKEARRQGQPVSQERLALADWTVVVTNVPVALLSVAEALLLLRVRWQIELLFKLWKSQGGQLATSRSQQPWRILCEVYAKLLALLCQHWLLVVAGWAVPDRSLVKAAQTVRAQALLLAAACGDRVRLEEVVTALARCLAAGCRLTKRRGRPSTYQRLLAMKEVA